MDYFWELILKDDSVIELPPAAAPVVQKRMANRDVINLKTRSIPYSEIKEFRQSDKQFGQPLLEAAAQAFREPIFFDVNGEQVMEAKWVKKSVSQKSYEKGYSGIPAYRKLGEDNGRVVIGFRLPVHEIDMTKVTPCTDAEVESLR
jgi:hypothetical protein